MPSARPCSPTICSHSPPPPPEEDWGIKFNYSAGEPAPEKITDKIFGFTQSIAELKVGAGQGWSGEGGRQGGEGVELGGGGGGW